MISVEIIKSWFKTGLKPTQEHFWVWMDSFWHKSEKIPISQIDGMDSVYNSINVLSAKNPRIIPSGQLQVFKVSQNENTSMLEIGDFVVGLVEGQFLQADYLGGNPMLLESYGIINEMPPPPQNDEMNIKK